jgi:hypothetical protein
VGLSIVALAAVAILPNNAVLHGPSGYVLPVPVDVPGWPAHAITPGWHNLVTVWERFDALWFLRIATSGYANGDGSAAFFPLYPLAIRWLSFLIGGHPLAAALLISNVSFFGSLVVLYALTTRELSEDIARRAVLYAAVFPTAFFFLAPYSESLFFLLVLLSFWWARSNRWVLAGIAAALAALTRNLGLALVVPLAVEAVAQTRRPRDLGAGDGAGPRHARWPVAWAFAPVVAVAGYLWFWQRISGDWLAPLHQQANWERHLVSPVSTLVNGYQQAVRWIGNYPGGYHFLDWVVTVPMILAAVYAIFRFRPTYPVYVWASLLVPLAFIFEDRPLMSVPRFVLPLFPIYWAAAVWTAKSHARHEIVLVSSSALLGVLLILFANWYYIF